MLRVYRIVFRKEFRELLRDRRSLFWLFAPPIILPGLGICAAIFIGTQAIRIASDGFPIIVENPEQAPALVELFDDEEGVRLVEAPPEDSEDPFGDAVVIVEIPEDFRDQLEETGTTYIQLATKDSALITFFGSAAVRGIIDTYSQDILDERLTEQGLTRDWLNPIQVGEERRATTESVTGSDDEGGAGILATIFLPLAVTSWLLGGGMGLILDTTVGEKERQTIENLLVTPASRIGIVMGKMTVVFIASMIVMSLWLAEGILLNSLSAASSELVNAQGASPYEVAEIIVNSGGNIFSLVAALLILIIPFTVMLNGLVMAWCAYAANYREANLFMAMIQLGLPASVLLTIFSLPAEVSEIVYVVPFFGTIVAIRDLFSGALSTQGLILNFVTGSIYASSGVALSAWVFGREWSLTRGLQ